MNPYPITNWQITITDGKRTVSKVEPMMGESSATNLGQKWAKAMGKSWRFVGVEQVEGVPA
jgi:hypothetical protein